MGLFIFQCVYKSETNEYVARLIAASLLLSLEGKARRELLGIKNRRGRKDYRVARKMLFVRCVCICLVKVAGA